MKVNCIYNACRAPSVAVIPEQRICHASELKIQDRRAAPESSSQSVPLNLQKGMLQMRSLVRCSSSHPRVLCIFRLLTTGSKSVLEEQVPRYYCATGGEQERSRAFLSPPGKQEVCWVTLQMLPDRALCCTGRQTKNSGLWWANLEEDSFPVPNLVMRSTLSMWTSADSWWMLMLITWGALMNLAALSDHVYTLNWPNMK